MRRTGSFSSYILSAAVLAAAWAGAASADIITLGDGTKVTGTMARQGEMMVITTAEGKKLEVRATDIAGVTLTSNITPAERAENAWKQLQPSLNKAAKLEDVIAILEKFENENHTTPAGVKAINAIASYKLLLTQSPVKFRGTWVAKDQVDVLTRAELDQAKPVIAVYKAGKPKEALDQAREGLKASPQNPHLLMVAGLSSFKLNQLQQAREFFVKVAEVNDSSVMAFNNLGVVSFQLNKAIEGLGFYGRALQAAPENRMLLDNIVEALVAAESVRNAPAYGALQRQFLQAETNLEAKQAKSGLFRYGSTWVTQEQQDRLLASKSAAKAALEAAEARQREATRTLDNIDARIHQAKSDVDALVNEYNNWVAQGAFAYYYDPNVLVRRDMVAADLERARRRLSTLMDQRNGAVETVGKIADDAAKMKADWAAINHDQVSGVQRIMDIGDDEVVPLPSAVVVPPVVERPVEKPLQPIVVQDIPQQPAVVERQAPISDYGYGQSIQYGTYGTVVPPLIIGNYGLPVFVRPAPGYHVGLPNVGGNLQPFIPMNGPAIPMFSPAGGGGFTPGGSGR